MTATFLVIYVPSVILVAPAVSGSVLLSSPSESELRCLAVGRHVVD